MYSPTFAHTSAKNLNIKDYLESFRSPSKYREENQPQQSRQSPPLRKHFRPESEQSTQDLHLLQQRYLQLQKNYKQLLQKTRVRNLQHNKLKEQLKQYKKMHERDTQQIQKLRCIIGLVNKRSAQTQVSQQELQWNGHIRNSRMNKFDQSTEDDIKFKMSSQKFYPKDKNKTAILPKDTPKEVTFRQSKKERLNQSRSKLTDSRMRMSRQKTHQIENSNTKGILLQYEKQLKRVGSGTGKKLTNSPYSQLRFVPGFKK